MGKREICHPSYNGSIKWHTSFTGDWLLNNVLGLLWGFFHWNLLLKTACSLSTKWRKHADSGPTTPSLCFLGSSKDGGMWGRDRGPAG